MNLDFYIKLFRLAGEDRRVFEGLAEDDALIQKCIADCAEMWREKMRKVFRDPPQCRQALLDRTALISNQGGIKSGYSPNVAAAFALYLSDKVEQRVHSLDFEARQSPGRGDKMETLLAAGTLVEVQKLSPSENPVEESGSWENWLPGSGDNKGSLPVGYAIRGVLMESLCVGECLHVYRIDRNGVSVHGHFQTTPLLSIEERFIGETFNSIYRITPVEIHSPEEEEI